MQKALRYTGYALGGIAALVLVLLIAARFLISSEQVRKAVLPLAEDALQREVELGDIEISLFSGIVLHDLTVMDKDGEEPFVRAGKVVLRYRFWPLLRLKVVVDEVRLEQPVWRVVRHADGTFNFSDLLEGKEQQPDNGEKTTEEADEKRSLSLLISSVALSDGQVRFVDYRSNAEKPVVLNLTSLDLRAEDITVSGPFPLEAGVSINGARLEMNGQVDPATRGGKITLRLADLNVPDFAPYFEKQQPGKIRALRIGCDIDLEGNARQLHSTGRIMLAGLQLASAKPASDPVPYPDLDLDYELRLDRPAALVELQRGRLSVGGLPIDLQGRMITSGESPAIEGNVTVTRLDLTTLPKILPPAVMGNLKSFNPAGFVNARLELEGNLDRPGDLLKSGQVRLEGVQASAGGLRPELTGNLSLRGATLQTQKLNLLLGEDRALLDLTAENLYGKPVRINSTLVADRLQLDALFGGRSKEGSKKDTRSDAAGKSVKKVLGPYKLPLYATGTMRVGQALWRGLLIEDLSARYQLRDNIFTLEQLTGKTAGGTFSETARVDLTVPGLAYKTRIETNAIQADPMLSVLAPKMSGTVFGLLNLKVDMQGRGTGAEDLKQNLSGNGDLVIADGKITGAGLVAGLADFLDLEELRVLRFTRAASQLTVKDGRVQVDGNLAGEQVRLAPTGSVGLDGTLDIGLPLRLAPTLTARLAGQNKFSRFLTDSQGWGALPLKVTGTVKAPRFALDTSTLGGTIRRGVQDQLQKTLQEKLLGPRDGSAQPKGTGDAPAEGSPEDSKTDKKSKEEQLLEGVMKGLFGK